MFKMFKTTVWKITWAYGIQRQDWINAWIPSNHIIYTYTEDRTNQETPHLEAYRININHLPVSACQSINL